MRPVIIRSLIVFIAMAVLGQVASGVTFTTTPTAVSNTYSGFLTLAIGGLTNKETVVIQKYIDVNTNGVIDGSDLLVQQFTLTDGTNSVIGGVTNLNVPGDLNAATGAITASLSFQNGDFVQNLVGKYFYKLSSPGGHFTPLTNGLSVTNFPFAQKFTGNVISNNTSTTVSNAIVILFPPPRPGHNGLGQPLGGVVVNRAGAYTLMMPAGTYTLLAVATNYVNNSQKAPLLTLGSGQTITTNLSLTNATSSITGKIVDAVNNTLGLPGVFMPLSSTNGLIAITFSDTNGNFTAHVSPNNKWSLGTDDSGLIVHGYVGYQNGTNINSGGSVTLAFPKATALFYGSIKDGLGNPLPGIDVYANDTANYVYQMDGYADPNGNYCVGALGLANDPWQADISTDSSPTNYVFSQSPINQNGGTNLTVGLAVRQDFTAVLATNHVTGNVKDSNGSNIAGVEVSASQTNGNTNYQASVDTDGNGNYTLNVANGTWAINVNCNGGSDSLSQLGSYACPNDQSAFISGNNATNNFIVQICGGVSITTPATLPVGEVNVYYDQFAQASSCSSTFSWSVIAGSFPPGLDGDPSSGEIFGTPTSSGTYTFTIQVSDGANITNKQFSLTISNALQVTTAALPNGTNGAAYSQQLQAVNGVPYGGAPYNWTVVSGSLPANLNLVTNGILSGILATSGQFNFTVEAADALGGISDQPFSLNIVNTNSSIAPPVGIFSAGGQALIYFPASGSNYVLQTTTNLATGPWVTATGGVSVTALIFSNTAAPAQFFRLH